MRFEERLKIEMQIDPETLSQPIPPMMLQNLVENIGGSWILCNKFLKSHGNSLSCQLVVFYCSSLRISMYSPLNFFQPPSTHPSLKGDIHFDHINGGEGGQFHIILTNFCLKTSILLPKIIIIYFFGFKNKIPNV